MVLQLGSGSHRGYYQSTLNVVWLYSIVADLKFTDFDVVEAYRKQQSLLEIMARNKCHKCPKLEEHYTLVKTQHTLKERVKQLRYELSDEALQQMPDFGKRVRDLL